MGSEMCIRDRRQILPKPFQEDHPPIWVAALPPATYEIAASKGIGVLSFGSSAPDSLAPYVKKYKEDIKNAKPVGKEINNQWASSTLGVCLKDGQKARNMGAESLKNFFGPDRPYVQGQKDIYAQLLEKWGGVPDHLDRIFPDTSMETMDLNLTTPWISLVVKPLPTKSGKT